MVDNVSQLKKEKNRSVNLWHKVEPSKKDKFQHLSLEGIMIEVIYPSKQIIKVPHPNSCGKSQQKVLIIITIYPFSSMDADKN